MIELRNILMLTFCYTMLLTGSSDLWFRLYGVLHDEASPAAVVCGTPASWCPGVTLATDGRIRNVKAAVKRWD